MDLPFLITLFFIGILIVEREDDFRLCEPMKSEPSLSPHSQSDIIFSSFFQINVPTLNICYNRKLLPIPKSQPSLKLAILLLLAGDVSLNLGPSTCSTGMVRLASLNVRPMKNKAASLADMARSGKIDIPAITETWSDTLLHKPRPHGRGGEVGFLISNKFKVTDYIIPSFSTFECICLRISGGSFEGFVLCMYHPEPLHSHTFYEEFQELLELLLPLAPEFYILGDFNLHVYKSKVPLLLNSAIFWNLLISNNMLIFRHTYMYTGLTYLSLGHPAQQLHQSQPVMGFLIIV